MTTPETELSPDTCMVLGLLYLIGKRWIRQPKLIDLLVDQLGDHPDCHQWSRHPVYRDCRHLEELFSVLKLGGSIIGQTTPNLIMPTPHTLGAFGERCFSSLSAETQAQLQQIATLI